MEECLKIIDFILDDLNLQLDELRDYIFNEQCTYSGEVWERQLRLYDECAIKKYQTEHIKKQILKTIKE